MSAIHGSVSSRRSLLVAVAALTLAAGCDSQSAPEPDGPNKREKHEVVYEVRTGGAADYLSLVISYRDESGNMDSARPRSMIWRRYVDIEDSRISEVSVDAAVSPDVTVEGPPDVPTLFCTITIDGVERTKSTGRGTVSCQVEPGDDHA